MSEYGQTHPIPVPLYAVTIHKVVAGGDIAAMEQALSEAEQQLKQYGDLSAAIEILKAEIAKLGATNRGPIIRPLYGRPIEDAIQSGDLDKMQAIATEAASYKGSDISAAVKKLHAEISKLETN